MTSDPTEALDALSRLRSLTLEIDACKRAEALAHANWIEARRKLRGAIEARDKALAGEFAELPLFDGETAPEAEADDPGQRPVFTCRGCGKATNLLRVKGDISHVCDDCRPRFFSEWVDRIHRLIRDQLGLASNARIPTISLHNAFERLLSPAEAAPEIIAETGLTPEARPAPEAEAAAKPTRGRKAGKGMGL